MISIFGSKLNVNSKEKIRARAVFQGDAGFAAGLPGEDLRKVRDEFHGQDRELHREAATLEEEEQVVERKAFAVTTMEAAFSRPLRTEHARGEITRVCLT